MEPTSSAGAYAKTLSLIKDLPLWLLTGVALSLIVFLYVPAFHDLASPTARPWVIFAAILFAILALCRFVSVVIAYASTRRAGRELRRTFHLTPIIEQCFISTSKQPDGSMVTQISAHFLAKNRTDKPLYLASARVIKPKIAGDHIQSLLLIKAVQGNMYGTAHVSKHFVPPHDTLPASLTILTRGTPKKCGKEIDTVLAVSDDDGNEQSVRLRLKTMNPPKPS